jgi:TetR/AcrR family transcriptional repressor of mexJK operon
MTAPAHRPELSPVKRRQILEGARLAFGELGYERASVDLVAARAGVGKATIYNHFGDKKALFAACYSEDADEIRAELRRSLQVVGGDPELAMRRVGEQLLRVLTSPAFVSLHRHAVAEADRFPEVGESFFARGPSVVYGAIADWLKRWEALGVLRLEDPRAAAVQFVLLCQGDLVVRAQLGILHRPSAAEVRATARNAVRTFLRAYQT